MLDAKELFAEAKKVLPGAAKATKPLNRLA